MTLPAAFGQSSPECKSQLRSHCLPRCCLRSLSSRDGSRCQDWHAPSPYLPVDLHSQRLPCSMVPVPMRLGSPEPARTRDSALLTELRLKPGSCPHPPPHLSLQAPDLAKPVTSQQENEPHPPHPIRPGAPEAQILRSGSFRPAGPSWSSPALPFTSAGSARRLNTPSLLPPQGLCTD